MDTRSTVNVSRYTKASCLVAICLLLGALAPVHAASHALIVAVSEYPALADNLQLEGPRSDAVVFRDLLLAQGFDADSITLLADGVDDAQLPTRRAVLAQMERLAEQAEDGDYVVMLFAGHGSQQPSAQDAAAEPDGLDEIFLPRDVAGWNDSVGVVENAITDDEINARITAIRDRGAFVWAIFDTCHSGTITRGMQAGDERPRDVKPGQLGIPKAALDAARKRAGKTRGQSAPEAPLAAESQTSGKGRLVVFSASQSYETTPEMLLPPGAADAKPFGLFSYHIAQALASASGPVTYRELIESVLQAYRGRLRYQPTPAYEGDGLDALVFGTENGGRQQWRLNRNRDKLELMAGQLHQLSPGAVLAVVPRAISGDDDVLGYVRVDAVRLNEADVTPYAHNDKPVFAPREIGQTAYARPVNVPVDFKLAVAELQPASCPSGKPAGSEWTRVRDALNTHPWAEGRLDWVRDAAAAQVGLCPMSDRVLLVNPSAPADGEMRAEDFPSVRLDTAGDPTPAVIEALRRASRVANLARIAQRQNASPAAGFSVSMTARPAGRSEPVPLDQAPPLTAGDKIDIAFRNGSRFPMDVTILGIDPGFGIYVIYPYSADETTRIEPGSAEISFAIEVDDETVGRDQIVVVAVPVKQKQQAVTDFTFLAQAGVPVSRERSRGAGGLEALVREAGFGATTRGGGRAVASDADDSAAFSFHGWQTVRGPEAE